MYFLCLILIELSQSAQRINPAKKGLQAKGKKTSSLDVKSVKFVEPLHKPEDDFVPLESEAENQAGEIDNSDIIDDEPLDLNIDDNQLTLF